MSLLSACRETARRTFRIQSLHPDQESAMLAVLNGRDAFVSLPTGFGKSMIYQVPAMIVERPTIVISPLIALMTDQECALNKRRGNVGPPSLRCPTSNGHYCGRRFVLWVCRSGSRPQSC